MKSNRERLVRLIICSILTGLAIVLMLFEFPIWFLPPFYQLDFSDLPAVVASVFIGPLYGTAVEFLKILLYLIIKPSTTAYVGEIANFLIGLSFILPIGVFFKYFRGKTKKNLLISLFLGILSIGIMGGVLNYFILLKAYSYFYEWPLEQIIATGTALNPNITNLFTFVMFATVPFNLIKGGLLSLAFFPLHNAMYERYRLN